MMSAPSLPAYIPVNEAIHVIQWRLETSLSERCELFIGQIIILLDGVFTRQIRSAPMGGPISPSIANLAMEDFEEKALDSALTKLHACYCYVDDTFMIFQEYTIQDFTDIISTLRVNTSNSLSRQKRMATYPSWTSW